MFDAVVGFLDCDKNICIIESLNKTENQHKR
jgi:hypothetical protein